MKILYIHCAPDLYGSSRSLLRLAKKQIDEGFEVNVILPYNGLLYEELKKIGAKVFVTNTDPTIRKTIFKSLHGFFSFVFDCLNSFYKFRKIAISTGVELIHSNTSVSVVGGIVARTLRIPHICHVRESYSGFGIFWLIYRKYLMLFSELIICVSKSMADQFPDNVHGKKVFTLNNGFPECEYPEVDKCEIDNFKKKYQLANHLIVGLIGRIILVRKGQDIFVNAAKIVMEKYPDVRFVIVGSTYPGNEYHLENLKRLISELNIEDEVILTGEITNIKPVYAAIDISIMASSTPEPFGGVTIESMAYGKPVIATNLGGNPEQIVDGQCGILVPPADPAAMAKAIISLIENPELRIKMGINGRERFLHEFTFDRFYINMKNYITEVVSKDKI